MLGKRIRDAGREALRGCIAPVTIGQTHVPTPDVRIAAGKGAVLGQVVSQVGIHGPVSMKGGRLQFVAIHEVRHGQLAPGEIEPVWV